MKSKTFALFPCLAALAVVAGDGVLHAVGEGVAEVELAGDIWGRYDHHKHLLGLHILQTIFAAIFRLEEALLLPPGVPSRLYILWAVGIREGASGVFPLPWLSSSLILRRFFHLLRLLLGLLLFLIIIRFLLGLKQLHHYVRNDVTLKIIGRVD